MAKHYISNKAASETHLQHHCPITQLKIQWNRDLVTFYGFSEIPENSNHGHRQRKFLGGFRYGLKTLKTLFLHYYFHS